MDSNKKFKNVFRFSRIGQPHIALIYSIESLIRSCFSFKWKYLKKYPTKCFSLMFSHFAARLINWIIISFFGGTQNAGFFSSAFRLSCHVTFYRLRWEFFTNFHLLLSFTFQFRPERKHIEINRAPLLTHKNECQTCMYTYESLIILFTFVYENSEYPSAK